MYRIGERKENERRHKKRWLVFWLILVIALIGGIIYLLNHLKPETKISESQAVIKKVSYQEKTKKIKYEETDFTIELPSEWKKEASQSSSYRMFTWSHINDKASESITVYQDTIPAKYAPNRIVIVEGSGAQVVVKGQVSDNCAAYTKNLATDKYQIGVPAKWEGVDFLCDQANQTRDVIGSSSKAGINTVIVTSPTTPNKHKFFFSYVNHSLKPDYSVFTDTIGTFRLK